MSLGSFTASVYKCTSLLILGKLRHRSQGVFIHIYSILLLYISRNILQFTNNYLHTVFIVMFLKFVKSLKMA